MRSSVRPTPRRSATQRLQSPSTETSFFTMAAAAAHHRTNNATILLHWHSLDRPGSAIACQDGRGMPPEAPTWTLPSAPAWDSRDNTRGSVIVHRKVTHLRPQSGTLEVVEGSSGVGGGNAEGGSSTYYTGLVTFSWVTSGMGTLERVHQGCLGLNGRTLTTNRSSSIQTSCARTSSTQSIRCHILAPSTPRPPRVGLSEPRPWRSRGVLSNGLALTAAARCAPWAAHSAVHKPSGARPLDVQGLPRRDQSDSTRENVTSALHSGSTRVRILAVTSPMISSEARSKRAAFRARQSRLFS